MDGRAVPPAEAAVVFGSGLAVVPDGLSVTDRILYGELGWPQSGVAGHGGELLVAGATLLAFGRSHAYEGWAREELERSVRDMAAAGVSRLVVTCATGSLRDDLRPGDAVVVERVVDLQEVPAETPPVLTVCDGEAAAATERVVGEHLRVRRGVYAAVAGPQYETPAEAAWLAGAADVVGMSAVHEVRAARAVGLPVRLLAVVTNRSGRSLSHDEVLAAGERAADGLRRSLGRLLSDPAVWPTVATVVAPDAVDEDVADDGTREHRTDARREA